MTWWRFEEQRFQQATRRIGIMPFEFPNGRSLRAAFEGADSLDDGQAKLRIEAKGYLDVAGLQKDSHGIWRGKATIKGGRPVGVTLDLEGNIYSELSHIRIEAAPYAPSGARD
jgi:hypothetical protein